MKILSVLCKDFKSFKSREFTLSERTFITADNYQGKTSIAEAIVFGLFGCTLSGSPRTDHFTRKDAKKMQVIVTFTVDGAEHTVERIQARASELYFDGKQAKQNDVDLVVDTREKFLATFWPSYFTSLPEKEGREMVMSLIQPPAQADIVARLDGAYQTLLKHTEMRNPDAVAKEIRQDIKLNESEVSRMDGKLEVLRQRSKREIPDEMTWDDTELTGLKDELHSLQSDTVSRIKEMKAELAGMGREYKAFKEQIQKAPTAPYNDGDACPVCAQSMTGTALEHALGHHTHQVSELEVKNAKLKAKCQTLLASAAEQKKQVEALEAECVVASTDDIKAQIATLEHQKAEVTVHNAQVTMMRLDQETAQAQVAEVESELQSCKDAVFQLGETIKAIGAYRAKLAEMQVAQLKQHLNHVDIELFKVTKTTAEIKDCFTVTYDGREYKSLSYSEQIRAGLEISSLFNKAMGTSYPVFIDNAESITHFDMPATEQLITASVVQGAELTISADAKEDAA